MERNESQAKSMMPKGIMLTLLGTHCVHTSMNRRKMKFISYIYTLGKKKICVFQVSALKKLGMVGWHYILFYQNILYRNCIFQYIFSHFSANLTTFCSQFTIKCLGSEQKPT